MDRELTYQMPFERLVKLSRSAGRKAFAISWVMCWLLVGLFCVAIILLIVFDEPSKAGKHPSGCRGSRRSGDACRRLLSPRFWALRRFGLRQMKARADYQSTVRFRQDGGGLRFATDEIEYYLKWPGISQMLMEHDGVAVSHG